jgi:sec-independent protein translocase protein TatB
MFDIGFLEIVVILIITLLVVGPERMPEIARKAGQFVGKVRNFVHSVKEDSSLRDTVRELQQAMDLKEEQQRFEHIQQDLYKGFDDVRDQINFDELQRPFANAEPTEDELQQARQQVPVTPVANANSPATSSTPQPSSQAGQPTQPKPSEQTSTLNAPSSASAAVIQPKIQAPTGETITPQPK